MRSVSGMSSTLWWVANGLAAAPPATDCSTGVSIWKAETAVTAVTEENDHATAQRQRRGNADRKWDNGQPRHKKQTASA